MGQQLLYVQKYLLSIHNTNLLIVVGGTLFGIGFFPPFSLPLLNHTNLKLSVLDCMYYDYINMFTLNIDFLSRNNTVLEPSCNKSQ